MSALQPELYKHPASSCGCMTKMPGAWIIFNVLIAGVDAVCILNDQKLSVLTNTDYACLKICKNQLSVKSFCFVLLLVLFQSNTYDGYLEALILYQGGLKREPCVCFLDLCQHVIMCPSRGGDQIHVLLGVLAHQSKSAHGLHQISLIIHTIHLY